jgi:hypothetical protein
MKNEENFRVILSSKFFSSSFFPFHVSRLKGVLKRVSGTEKLPLMHACELNKVRKRMLKFEWGFLEKGEMTFMKLDCCVVYLIEAGDNKSHIHANCCFLSVK